MRHLMRTLALIPLLMVSMGAAHAAGYADTRNSLILRAAPTESIK
jgi:hypothetical protein